MKKFMIAVLAVILFPMQAVAGEVVRLTEFTDENGKRIVYETTKDVIEKCPIWRMDEEPPFPIHRAVELAMQWIREKYPKFTNFDIVNISLSKTWNEKYKDMWYYSIFFNANVDLNGIKASSYFTVLVLMDGTVVGPSSPKNNE